MARSRTRSTTKTSGRANSVPAIEVCDPSLYAPFDVNPGVLAKDNVFTCMTCGSSVEAHPELPWEWWSHHVGNCPDKKSTCSENRTVDFGVSPVALDGVTTEGCADGKNGSS